MPFKIVQTHERGNFFLSCVPSAWENNSLLLWPKKGSKKLHKNENSLPGDDWISTPCQLKRCDLTYDKAQLEMIRMQRDSDTEDDRLPKKQHQININDMNELALQCIMNKENVSPITELPELNIQQEPAQGEKVCVPSNILATPTEDPTIITSETPLIVQQETESEEYIWIAPNHPEKSYVDESVLKRFDELENTQHKILFQLSQLGTKIDAFLKQTQQQKVTSNVGFKPIDDIDSLQNFDDALKNKDTIDIFKEKLSVVCGSGKGRGPNNCFALIDVMFTRRFLTECSWAGGSKKAELKKNCFKAYSRVINLFFEIIHYSDKTFTLLECELFFLNILKNSERLLSAKMIRASATKIRGKGNGKKSKTITTEVTDAAVQPKPTVSLTFPALSVVSSQPQTSQSDSLQGTPTKGVVSYQPQVTQPDK